MVCACSWLKKLQADIFLLICHDQLGHLEALYQRSVIEKAENGLVHQRRPAQDPQGVFLRIAYHGPRVVVLVEVKNPVAASRQAPRQKGGEAYLQFRARRGICDARHALDGFCLAAVRALVADPHSDVGYVG